MLFTLLTFPLHCTLDIDQSRRGRLFTRPFSNEAIKSVLPWLSKGAKRTTQIICSLSKQHYFSHPAVRMHILLLRRPGPCGPVVPVQHCIAGEHIRKKNSHIKRKQAATGCTRNFSCKYKLPFGIAQAICNI